MILEDPCMMTFLRFDTVPKKFPDYHQYFQRRRKIFWAPLGALINCLGAHFSVSWSDSVISRSILQYPNRLCSTGIDFVVLQSRLRTTGIDSVVPE